MHVDRVEERFKRAILLSLRKQMTLEKEGKKELATITAERAVFLGMRIVLGVSRYKQYVTVLYYAKQTTRPNISASLRQ